MFISNYAISNFLKQWYQNTAPASVRATAYFGLIVAGSGSWAASTAYTVGEYVLPATPNGHLYKCTTAGTSNSTAPAWPTTSGATIADGTVVWTEQTLQIEAGVYPEVSGGSYARVAVSCNATDFPASGLRAVSNGAAITFASPTANWGLIYGMVDTDASTAGDLIAWGPLTSPQTLNSGNPAPSFAINAYTLTVDIA